jgi:phenylpropionate dioxygenase-like ring-hydroxylating dioxygenase large terminal subunit
MSRPAGALELTPTLPGSYYCDPEILKAEFEKIFYRSWLYACREDRLAEPGEYLTLAIGQESVLIVRGRDRQLRAFFNVCRHRGSRLCAGESGALQGTIQCPYHAWTYGLDGRLVGTPNVKESDGLDRQEYSLHPVALEIWRGCVFVNLDGSRASFASQASQAESRTRNYPLADLKVAHRTVHDVEANWKILVENYHECYHCPGVHPELCDIVPLYRSGVVDGAGSDVNAYFREGATTFTHGGTTRRPLFPGLSEKEQRLYTGEMFFPSVWINFLPDFVQIRSLWPLGPTRTRLIAEWLFEPATMARKDFDPTDAIEFTQLIADQDWRVCEGVQKGVGSRAHRHGVLIPEESALVEFDRWVLERLEGRA